MSFFCDLWDWFVDFSDEYPRVFTAGFVLMIPAVLISLCVGLVRVGAEMSFPGDLAQIEQLRADVARVDVGENEDVIGQVTALNQVIRANQRYRQIWWGRICTPEEWEDVKVIELKRNAEVGQ